MIEVPGGEVNGITERLKQLTYCPSRPQMHMAGQLSGAYDPDHQRTAPPDCMWCRTPIERIFDVFRFQR